MEQTQLFLWVGGDKDDRFAPRICPYDTLLLSVSDKPAYDYLSPELSFTYKHKLPPTHRGGFCRNAIPLQCWS